MPNLLTLVSHRKCFCLTEETQTAGTILSILKSGPAQILIEHISKEHVDQRTLQRKLI